MYSFDKLALLLVSLICLACVMYIGLQPGQATANATMILGGLVAFLGSAQTYLFSVLRSESQTRGDVPPATPVAPPAVPAAPVAVPEAPPQP